jgi:phage terminase large subunit-like protein
VTDYPALCATDADRSAYDIAVAGGWPELVRTKADLRAIEAGCYYSADHAEYARSFMHDVLFVQPGVPFRLLDWQWHDVVKPIYGWLRKDGTRRFRECYIEVAKGNGKSFLCSALCLYMLVGEDRYGVEVYNAASDRSQAEIVFREAAKIVQSSPALNRVLKVIYSTKRITRKGKANVPISIMRALSKDSYNSQGIKAFALICDEIHCWRDREAFGSLRYAANKVDESLCFMITTAGADRTSIGYSEHTKAKKLLDGTVAYQDYYAVIYAADEADDIQAESTWRKANPALGVTIRLEELKSAAEKAKDSTSESFLFRRYRLNQWVHGSDTSWLSMDSWAACKPRLPEEALLGKPCWAGLDLSNTDDLTALVLAFRHEDKGFDLLTYVWCPADTIASRTQKQNIPYSTWVKDGYIEATPGDYVDKEFIRHRVNEIGERFNIRQIALDRNWQGDQLYFGLSNDGFSVACFNQGYLAFDAPTKNFELLVRSGDLHHGNHPVLTWCASNATLSSDRNGAVKPVKPARGKTDKVDAIIAAVMAVAAANGALNSQLSFYDHYRSAPIPIV